MMLSRLTFAAVLLMSSAGHGLKRNTWQARLDRSLLEVDLGLGSRLRLLSKAVTDPTLLEDVQSSVAILSNQGFAKGHPEVIDKLWPKGTTARADLEGITALRKQVPEVIETLRQQPIFPNPGEADTQAGTPTIPDLSTVVSSLVTLATDPSKQMELQDELTNVVRRTPKGLETPGYKVVGAVEGPVVLGSPEEIQIRAYDQFTVARTPMKGSAFGAGGSGAGFNTLASYLFGQNAAGQRMAMTMPVEVSLREPSAGSAGAAARGAGEGEDDASMAFVLPRSFADAPPEPLDGSDIFIDTVAPRLVAVKSFAGIVTDEEVERQKAALLEALANSAGYAPADGGSMVSVLQYNSPITVPWRRRNEVAMVVTTTSAGMPAEGEDATEGKNSDVMTVPPPPPTMPVTVVQSPETGLDYSQVDDDDQVPEVQADDASVVCAEGEAAHPVPEPADSDAGPGVGVLRGEVDGPSTSSSDQEQK
mmetsp:Transcript_5874/g.16015  ORF Transcript_5874/g.16015 Transcript_5874/m.16015 type:complete len:477 (+) Transcript_5874:47-1477(+)